MAVIRRKSVELEPVAEGGWVSAPTEFTRRCVHMDIVGETGTGRTSLALSAPGPIGLAHTAEKIHGVVQRYAKQKQVRMVNFGGTFVGSPQEISNQSVPLWNGMTSAWYAAINTWAKTVIMDTATEGWEMIRLARFGTPKPQGRTDNLYGPVNAEWLSLFKHARSQERCNVITIHQVKDEYLDKINRSTGKQESVKTGRLVRAGQKSMPYVADVIIETTKVDGAFVATIRKGWFNAMTEGTEFRDDEISFSSIMAYITETEVSEWT